MFSWLKKANIQKNRKEKIFSLLAVLCIHAVLLFFVINRYSKGSLSFSKTNNFKENNTLAPGSSLNNRGCYLIICEKERIQLKEQKMINLAKINKIIPSISPNSGYSEKQPFTISIDTMPQAKKESKLPSSVKKRLRSSYKVKKRTELEAVKHLAHKAFRAKFFANQTPKLPEPVKKQRVSTKGVNSLISGAQVLKAIDPQYPYYARLHGQEGQVILSVQVLSDGIVGKIIIISSSKFKSLDNSAIKAAGQFKFVPARMLGINVSSTKQLSFLFKLSDEKKL